MRNGSDAKRLTEELGHEAFTAVLLDVTDMVAVQNAAQLVRSALHGKTLLALINNAGVGYSAMLPISN